MKKSKLKEIIKEVLSESNVVKFNIGDRVEFIMTGTVKENRYTRNMLSVELDNDSIINVDVNDSDVKKLEF